MAVDGSAVAIWSNQGGQETYEEGRVYTTYVVMYRVKVTSAQDGKATVLGASGLPVPGTSTYAFGSETDSTAICKGRSPSRLAGSSLTWLVQCTFDNRPATAAQEQAESGNELLDENGDIVTDPEDAAKVVEIEPVTVRMLVRKAYFKGVFNAGGTDLGLAPPGLVVDTKSAITNSAGTPRRVEIERSLFLYRISKNYNVWDGSLLAYADTINSSDFTISNSDSFGVKFTQKIDAFCGRMMAIRPRERRTGGTLWYRVQFEILHDPDNWRHKELDQGFAIVEEAGDDDGFGGSMSMGYSPRPATAPARAITDRTGIEPRDEQLLNGVGRLLEPVDPTLAKYLHWAPREELNYNSLGFDK